MVMGTVSGVLFAVGMCIALLPEWGAFNQGIMTGCCFSYYHFTDSNCQEDELDLSLQV